MTQTSRGNESHTGSHSNGCRGVVSFHAPPPVGDGPLPGHHCREKAEHLLLNTHSDSSEALAALCRAHCERRAVYARRWRCCSKAPHKPRQCRGTCAAANAPRARAGNRRCVRNCTRVRPPFFLGGGGSTFKNSAVQCASDLQQHSIAAVL